MRGFAGYFILNVALKQFLEVSNGKVCEEGLMSWERERGKEEKGTAGRRPVLWSASSRKREGSWLSPWRENHWPGQEGLFNKEAQNWWSMWTVCFLGGDWSTRLLLKKKINSIFAALSIGSHSRFHRERAMRNNPDSLQMEVHLTRGHGARDNCSSPKGDLSLWYNLTLNSCWQMSIHQHCWQDRAAPGWEHTCCTHTHTAVYHFARSLWLRVSFLWRAPFFTAASSSRGFYQL